MLMIQVRIMHSTLQISNHFNSLLICNCSRSDHVIVMWRHLYRCFLKQKNPYGIFTDDLTIGINQLSPNKGLVNHALNLPSIVRAEFVFVKNSTFGYFDFFQGIPNNKIGIISWFQSTFTMIKFSQLCRISW